MTIRLPTRIVIPRDLRAPRVESPHLFLTDTKRQSAFEDLRRAISRQTLIGSIQQELGD